MRNLIGGTDIGLVRTTNQDRFETVSISDTLAFAVLCDGMGGQNGGNIASDIATAHAREALAKDISDGMSELSLRSVLLSAVSGANALVYDAAQKDPALSGMGTTMILAVFTADTLYIAYVGDSRVYLVNEQSVQQLTKDHTVVQMLVDLGEITEDDARSHPKRHFITRAVGVGPHIDVDFLVQPLGQGDMVLLCSDGLYNYMAAGTLYGLLSRCIAEGNVQPLIDLANTGGGTDNVTAVVAK